MSEHVYRGAVEFKMTEQVEQWICIKFCVKLEHSSMETYSKDSEGYSDGQLVICSFIMRTYLFMHRILCRVFWQNVKSPSWLSPSIAQIWHPVTLTFPQTKIIFDREEISEIQENTTEQLMVIGKTVWGPKMPTLKRTKASLSCVQCFLYLLSSPVNVAFS